MLASLSGVIFIWKVFGKYVQNNLGLLVSFSAGVFLVLVVGLFNEIFSESENILSPILWVGFGIVIVSLLFKLLPNFHHHHDDSHEHEKHTGIDAKRIVFSDAIHNIGDGILLASSFMVSISLGIAATISIFIHEIVQEISEFFVLRQAGLSTKKALIVNFVSSGTILIGSVGGFFLLEKFETLEIPLLAISAGAFLIVVIKDLIPESIRHSREKKNYWKHIVSFLIGVSIMFNINSIFPHVGHGHGVDNHDYEEVEHEDDL